MLSRLKGVSKDPFLRQNAIFFAGSMVVAVVNYAYHPMVSRFLSVRDFGEVVTLLSLSAQFGVVIGIFGTVATNIRVRGERIVAGRSMLLELQSFAVILAGVASCLLLAGTPYLTRVLSFHSTSPFLVLSAILLVSVSYNFASSGLQGARRFGELSIASFIMAIGRLLFGILFVVLGWNTLGAVAGIFIAQLVALFYILRIHTDDAGTDVFVRPHFDTLFLAELKYGLLVFAGTGFITLLYTADVIAVKYFFDPTIAGMYGGIETIARIIFFATGSIAGVLFPSLSQSHTSQENLRNFRKAVILTLVVTCSGLFVLWFFPKLVIGLMLGERYLPLANLLPKLALVVSLTSLLNIFMIYFLALRKVQLLFLGMTGTVLLALSIGVKHETVQDIVNDFLIVNSLSLVLFLWVFWRDVVRSRNEVHP